jgi:4-alpha-glucanotransferase
MKFGELDHYYTGIAIPVSALRSEHSCGVGDFLDLSALAHFCKQSGFEVIQILPVNDTGSQSSPYSALSAFALHPIYIRLQELPFAADFMEEIESAKMKHENQRRLHYNEVLSFKLGILHRMFEQNKKTILADEELVNWIGLNAWVKPYSVFSYLKKQYNYYHWRSWPKLQNPSVSDIENFWNEEYEDCIFFAWIQYHLERQLSSAAHAMEKLGIYLKGDIPILMNEDSVDVWMYRKNFNTESKAGAPPDMYSSTGQNWDFPIYRWDVLEKDDYSFWRSRLKQADKFYHAYRIDHVLGFFRIYTIPANNRTGRLGYFFPSHLISAEDFHKIGFDDGRIKWLAVPHIPESEIDESFGGLSERIKKCYLNRIGNEPLFNLKPEYDGEKNIESLDEDDKVKVVLVKWQRDRALIEAKPGYFHRVWTYGDSSAFRSLPVDEQKLFEQVLKDSEEESEKIWEKQGTRLLTMMQDTTDMLMCAEDLGVVPACVPKVLKELNVLSLKIERWTRKWDEPGAPYVAHTHYPRLSVCTPSVHDTNTLNGWWELELSDEEKAKYLKHIHYKGSVKGGYSVELAAYIFAHLLDTSSILCVFQIQELFSLITELRASNPEDDRINVPGTISDLNWTYRIYSSLEFLENYEKFSSYLKTIINKRREKIMETKNQEI